MKQSSKRKYVFGPVPSRRLGRSLGIDLVPFKTCSYDCIYCQLGRTTRKTASLREYVPAEEVLAQVQQKLAEIPPPDYITLSGSGEPTLYSRIGDIINGIKAMTDVPVAVLTNASLFWIDRVRSAVCEADIIVPSLDAGDETMFRLVNRPHADISFEKMVAGLCALREEYRGLMWLEVFLVGGISDNPEAVLKIKDLTDRMSPDRIQLNTAVRTPAEDFVRAVDQETMEKMCALFGARGEIIADYSKIHARQEFHSTMEEVLETLRRRPCTIDDLSCGLHIHRNEAIKYVQELQDKHLIGIETRDSKLFYRVIGNKTKNSI
jgi:wyosine [tRNA(Phe)-imidazoG37] synthetase (radical SAM superfamily)